MVKQAFIPPLYTRLLFAGYRPPPAHIVVQGRGQLNIYFCHYQGCEQNPQMLQMCSSTIRTCWNVFGAAAHPYSHCLMGLLQQQGISLPAANIDPEDELTASETGQS